MEWPIDVPEKWARCYVQFWKAHKLEESIRITQEAFDVLTRGVKQEPKNRSDWHIFIIERNTPEPRPQRKATMIKQQAPKKALLLEILADDELPAPALLEAPREPAIIESNQYTLLDILTDCDEAPDFNF